MMVPLLFLVVASALLGAVVGSFLNVCIYRIPREGMSVIYPLRSHCTSCGFELPWHDNVPILSWLWLGGRCRSCRAPVSARYLLVEALAATLFGVLAHRYLAPPDPQPWAFLMVAALVAACIVVSFIDQDLQIIPDEITLWGMMAVPIAALLAPDLHLPSSGPLFALLAAVAGPLEAAGAALPPSFRSPLGLGLALALAVPAAAAAGLWGYLSYWRIAHAGEPKRRRDGALAGVLSGSACCALCAMALRPEWIFHPRIYALWSALAGMGVGAGLIFVVGILGRQVFRKEAMGFGDVKLMGLLGGFAGWSGVLAGFALACGLGSAVGIYRLVRYQNRYLPFGPYLVMGCLFMIVWPDAFREALAWYMALFR